MGSPSRPPCAASTRRSSRQGSSRKPAAASSMSALPRAASARKPSGASGRPRSERHDLGLKTRLEEDLKAAMRSGDTTRRDTLRFALAAIQREAVDRRQAAVDTLIAAGKSEGERATALAEKEPSEPDDAAVRDDPQNQAESR